jgi:hypothetical protein
MEVAGIDDERLVRVTPDDIAMGNVVRPGSPAVRLPGEQVRHAGGLRGP